jgi:organic hydroperoxide reductase OsmC/OhrA
MSLLPIADGSFQLAATLDVALPAIDDRETATQLVREAHQLCPYSNATRGNIDVEILLDGKSVSGNRRGPRERS